MTVGSCIWPGRLVQECYLLCGGQSCSLGGPSLLTAGGLPCPGAQPGSSLAGAAHLSAQLPRCWACGRPACCLASSAMRSASALMHEQRVGVCMGACIVKLLACLIDAPTTEPPPQRPQALHIAGPGLCPQAPHPHPPGCIQLFSAPQRAARCAPRARPTARGAA